MATFSLEDIQKLLGDIYKSQSESSIKREQQMLNLLSSRISEFNYNPNYDDYFENWFQRVEPIIKIDGADLSEEAKVRLIISKLSNIVFKRYANLLLPRKPTDLNLEETIKLLKKNFGKNISIFNERYNCMKMIKKSTEDFDTFGSKVNAACENINFTSMSIDEFKCLIFTCGLQAPDDGEIRTRIIAKMDEKPKLTLDEAIQECKRFSTIKNDSKMIQQGTSSNVNAINQSFQRQNQQKNKNSYQVSNNAQSFKKPPYSCWKCGGDHYVSYCKFSTHKCQKCNKIGHKEGFCFKNNKSKVQEKEKFNDTKAKSKAIFSIAQINYSLKRKFALVKINNRDLVKFQIDTASDITLISKETWLGMGRPKYEHTTHRAKDASGNLINLIGEFDCDFSIKNMKGHGICYITENKNMNLLGIEWMEKLKLWDVPLNSICSSIESQNKNKSENLIDELISKFPKVFDKSLGHCTKAKAKLILKEGAQPKFNPKRPVAMAAIEQINKEIDRLEHEKIISRVDYSEWAAPIVAVKKPNGKIRLCADYSTGLNDALHLHQFPLPSAEEIFAKLNNGKIYSKIDLAEAYLQIEVSEESKELLTINTHRGLFVFNRLPFGVKSAPAIFQQVMDSMLTGLEGTVAYLDDILVMGSNQEDHKKNLFAVLKRIEDFGFHINLEKCDFEMREIKYLGMIIDEKGRRPDPEKIESIVKMPPPKNTKELKSLLGMINYYGTFIKELYRLRPPLDSLLRKDAKWIWTKECQDCFERIKTILKSPLLLTHFNPNLEIKVAADASEYAIGGVIIHVFPDGSEKAIAHCSRTLTPAEKKYAQIEKEGLALVFAIKKFHKFLFGRKFTLLTDHQPLVSIFGSKKGIPIYTANRLQRWAIILLAYDFKIQYVSTIKFGQADALSRLIEQNKTEEINEDVVISAIFQESDIRCILEESVESLPVTSKQIAEETRKDTLLQKVHGYILDGWPNNIDNNNLKQFFNRRNGLSCINDCIMFGERVVIPEKIKSRVLEQLHRGHPGITRMKALARSYVYWPGLDSEIEEMVKSCEKCAEASKLPPHAQPIPWARENKPWSRVHIDFAGPYKGKNFLVVVDSYSKWPEIITMKSTTTEYTIEKLNEIFSRFGMPEKIVTDNGTQFTSVRFELFCKNKGIEHIRTSPYHPQSNGQAERFVDTLKRALTKLKGEGTVEETLQSFLFYYRLTPIPSLPEGKSPSEWFLGRKIRNPLDLMKPSSSQEDDEKLRTRVRVLQPGDLVFAKNFREGPNWLPGKITKRKGKVIYVVEMDGKSWTRHINHLRRRYADPGDVQGNVKNMLDTFSEIPLCEPGEQGEEDLEPENEENQALQGPATPPSRSVPPTPPRTASPANQPVRRSSRIPKPTQRYSP